MLMSTALTGQATLNTLTEGLLKSILEELLPRLQPPQSKSLKQSQIVLELNIAGANYQLIRCCQPVELEQQLSPRELEIVHLIAQGLPNKCIAKTLNISPWTVATHVRRIFHKLKVTSRAEMVAQVIQIGDR